MPRPDRIAWPAVASSVALLMAACRPAASGLEASSSVALSPPVERPSFLVIAIDDLNDWVGPLGGHPRVRTPAMDALAARGTTFTNAHAQAPVCNPSRTSLLTGLRPTTTGAYALDGWFREAPALAGHPTFFQALRARGWRTRTTGKVFHDGTPPRPAQQDGSEVDDWGFLGGFLPRPERRLVPGDITHPMIDWGVYPERDEQQDDWQVAQWAIAALRAPPAGPFVLAVGFRHPHVPLYATRRWFEPYPDDDAILPPIDEDDRADVPRFAWYLHWKLPEPRLAWLRANQQLRGKVRSYLASISFVDHLVGRVLDALAASPAARRTIVVLLSDHGYHLGEKGITGKNSLWERSTRVPLIVAGPGVAAGARVDSPAELLDVYPTLLELAGVPATAPLDGESLVPRLRDARAARTRPALTSHGPGNHAVRDGHHRYIRYADGSEELYDLRADPNEWQNLAGREEHAAVLRRLRAELAALLPPGGPAPPLPGHRLRLPELVDGQPVWEGESIPPGAPIPGP